MKILALDTATRATTVALWVPPGEPLELRDDPGRGERPRHTTRLLPMTAALLERAQIGWEDIDRIAVGVGPGTFTGPRLGIAPARPPGLGRTDPPVDGARPASHGRRVARRGCTSRRLNKRDAHQQVGAPRPTLGHRQVEGTAHGQQVRRQRGRTEGGGCADGVIPSRPERMAG